MLGKIIGGALTYPPHRIILNGMQIFNSTDEQLIQAGYKTIVETDIPEDPAPDGWHYEAVYTDGESITQSWVLVENEEVPSTPTLESRVSVLEQEQSQMNVIFEEVINSGS